VGNTYKKRKPSYEAYQWGTDTADDINSCLAKYSSARIEAGWWAKDCGFLSIWDPKKRDYVDYNINLGDWIVIRSDGKVKVMDSETLHNKYEEKK
jgi:hypothetical protein